VLTAVAFGLYSSPRRQMCFECDRLFSPKSPSCTEIGRDRSEPTPQAPVGAADGIEVQIGSVDAGVMTRQLVEAVSRVHYPVSVYDHETVAELVFLGAVTL
jgi:hypothetical protein